MKRIYVNLHTHFDYVFNTNWPGKVLLELLCKNLDTFKILRYSVGTDSVVICT